MTPERWRQVSQIFHTARARDAETRSRYLEEACADDGALRAEVDAMLVAHGADTQFGETPVTVSTVRTPLLAAGTTIGSYRVERLIGIGGMGEVYRARDTKLGRDVAIKVLPAAFTSDAGRVARFEREARLLAALNHPNIAAIYGLEEAPAGPAEGGHPVRALVMELVDGETLADRVAKGLLPAKEALHLARQIAEALEAAHERGIVHRDLKPANIKVTPDGTVKVLDFGLAKAFTHDGGGIDLSQAPTLTVNRTQEGVIAGTPAYMSPEQARGQPVDRRSDIWAFGCVLYEMLTGQPPFQGETISDTIAAVLGREPAWDALPRTTPLAIRKLIRRCLAKDRRQRLSDVTAIRLEIDESVITSPGETIAAIPGDRRPLSSRRAVTGAIGIALLVGVLAGGSAIWVVMGPAPRVTRTTIIPPADAPLALSFGRNVAIAPDGRRIVYVAGDGTQLAVRALDQLQPTILTGLGAPTQPVFSPDGQWIAFFDGFVALKKIPTTGGRAVTLARLVGGPRGATWGPDDTIIFAVDHTTTGLLRVSSAGGEPEVLTASGRWPELVPGGDVVLFTNNGQVEALNLRTRARRMILSGATHAQYVVPGYLMYPSAGTLLAAPFDLNRLEATGTPVSVIKGLRTPPSGVADVSVASNGTLIYVPGGSLQATVSRSAVDALTPRPRTLMWVDRNGREEELGAPLRPYRYPRLSPDGTKAAVEVQDSDWNIWIWDFVRQTLTRLTLDSAHHQYPVWTPDGQKIVFRSPREGPFNLYGQAANGTGTVESLVPSPNEQTPYGVTPDGKYLVLREDTIKTQGDLVLLALDGSRRLSPLIQTSSNERNAELSPDGRWLAYESDESGREEIYVRPFPNINGGRWQVSIDGGTRPLWARNGLELFYWAPDGAVLGVTLTSEGGTLRASAPSRLLEGRYFTGLGRTYDVSVDGRHFLMVKERADESTRTTENSQPAIVVVQNWIEELKRLVAR